MSENDGDIEQEVRDAIAFLSSNFDALRSVLSNSDVEDAWLDFGYFLRIGNGTFAQCDYLPPELLRLAGQLNIGIELTLYPASTVAN